MGTLAVAGAGAPTGAAASTGVPLASPVPPDVFLDVDAKPTLNWSVPDRYAASWNAYDPTSATYDPDFVNPSSWSINIDGCQSTSVRRITGYTFTLAQVGTAWTFTRNTSACDLRLHNILPAQGVYRLGLSCTLILGSPLASAHRQVASPKFATT